MCIIGLYLQIRINPIIPTEEELESEFKPRQDGKSTIRHPPIPGTEKGKSTRKNDKTTTSNPPRDNTANVYEEIQYLKDDLAYTNRRMYKMQKRGR
jgi:hypothetical protein